MLSHLKSNKDSFFHQCSGLSDGVKSCGELDRGKEIPMGSKNGLTYILDLRYYSIISSIVPLLRYNYKLGGLGCRLGLYRKVICRICVI
jgi:hypothetical protein